LYPNINQFSQKTIMSKSILSELILSESIIFKVEPNTHLITFSLTSSLGFEFSFKNTLVLNRLSKNFTTHYIFI